MPFLRRRSQQGQVVVLFALGSAALVAFVGLVMMAGMIYWNQRELQADVDASALAGAAQLPGGSCSSTSSADQNVITTAVDTLSTRLAPGSTPPSTGSWTCGSPLGPLSFGGNFKATFCYPWQGRADEVAVLINQSSLPFFFQNFLGSQGATTVGAQSCTSAPLQQSTSGGPAVGGWAVAQRNFYELPKSFGLVAAHGIQCQGTGSKVDVGGSVYAGPNSIAGAASIVHNGNCAIYAHKTTDPNGNTDWGDIIAYDQTPLGTCTSSSNPCWLGSAGSCVAPSAANSYYGNGTKASFCADGFELQGYSNPNCGVSYYPSLSSAPGSMYMTTSEVSSSPSGNPNPCDGVPPLVSVWTAASFATPEPNLDSNAIATLSNPSGGPGSGCSSSQTLSSISFSYNSTTYTGFGTGPNTVTVDSNSWVHFHPGCYGYLDIQALVGNGSVLKGAVFDPGFYYFNGYGSSTGGGICMDGKTTQTLGQGITLEFVNGASFSTGSCSSTPSSGCGSSKQCDFGSSTALDAGATGGTYPSAGYTWFSAPCSSATLSQCPITSTMASSSPYSWCPSTDSACWNVLIWAPSTITGEFYIKGPSQTSYFLGDVIWPGPSGGTPGSNTAGCEFDANSGGQLVGEFICDTMQIQGGSSGGVASVGQNMASSSGSPPEAQLVE